MLPGRAGLVGNATKKLYPGSEEHCVAVISDRMKHRVAGTQTMSWTSEHVPWRLLPSVNILQRAASRSITST